MRILSYFLLCCGLLQSVTIHARDLPAGVFCAPFLIPREEPNQRIIQCQLSEKSSGDFAQTLSSYHEYDSLGRLSYVYRPYERNTEQIYTYSFTGDTVWVSGCWNADPHYTEMFVRTSNRKAVIRRTTDSGCTIEEIRLNKRNRVRQIRQYHCGNEQWKMKYVSHRRRARLYYVHRLKPHEKSYYRDNRIRKVKTQTDAHTVSAMTYVYNKEKQLVRTEQSKTTGSLSVLVTSSNYAYKGSTTTIRRFDPIDRGIIQELFYDVLGREIGSRTRLDSGKFVSGYIIYRAK